MNAVAGMAWIQVLIVTEFNLQLMKYYLYFQACLGISTLLFFVPTPLASSHQAGSLVLLSTALWLSHELKNMKYIPK